MIRTEMNIADICLQYNLRYENTIDYFQWHMKYSYAIAEDVLTLSDNSFREQQKAFSPGVPLSYMEYRMLAEVTGKSLYNHNAFIFHSVAILWREYAWLITGPSGVGKTTQYRNWKMQYPDEISMICGDMPVLKKNKDGIVHVYPSPWNGKECIGFDNHLNYPLGGIVYLVQSDSNYITSINFHDMILPLWDQFVGQPDSESHIISMSAFADYVFSKYPVWQFNNRGDTSSTNILRYTFQNSIVDHIPIYDDI